MNGGAIEPGLRKDFVLAGNATLTLRGRDKHFTFKIKKIEKPKGSATHWVSVLYGPDNERNFKFIGGITAKGFYVSDQSKVSAESDSARAFGWFWRHPESRAVAVLHAGTCGRCGRLLTTPESIRTGLGPVCGGRESRAQQDLSDFEDAGNPADY